MVHFSKGSFVERVFSSQVFYVTRSYTAYLVWIWRVYAFLHEDIVLCIMIFT